MDHISSFMKKCRHWRHLPYEFKFKIAKSYYLLSFLLSHCWLAIPQLVLQADWQEVWHSPHPPFLALSQRLRVSRVLICFIIISSVCRNISINYTPTKALSQHLWCIFYSSSFCFLIALGIWLSAGRCFLRLMPTMTAKIAAINENATNP